MHIITSIGGRKINERENGAFVVDINFINYAALNGHKVTVIVSKQRSNGFINCSQIDIVGKFLSGDFLLTRLINNLWTGFLLARLYFLYPNAIFRVNSFFSSLLEIVPLLILSRCKCNFFVQFHHKDSNPLRNYISKILLRCARIIICPSQSAWYELKHLLGYFPGEVFVVHHGVDEKFFIKKNQNSKDSIGANLMNNDSNFRLLFVGTLEPRKNPFKLLNLANDLYGQLSFEIAIVGIGPEIYKMREMCSGKPWASSVCFMGELSDQEKLKAYANSDLFVFPSKQEGFGLVICEAMAAGLPVLAFNISAMPEIIQSGTGFVVDVDNTAAMVEVILKLAKNRSLLKELSLGAYSHAKKNFCWSNKVNEICNHLSTLSSMHDSKPSPALTNKK